MSYRVVNGKMYPVQPLESFSKKLPENNKKSNGTDFKNVLDNEVKKKESFVISAHAASRLNSRNITLNENDMKVINDGINTADKKGCKDSVIFYKDTAFVTSIKNRTIVTAIDKDSCKQNVFTNIDSVVML